MRSGDVEGSAGAVDDAGLGSWAPEGCGPVGDGGRGSWAPEGYRLVATLPRGRASQSFVADKGGQRWVLRRLPGAAGAGVDTVLNDVAERLSSQSGVVAVRPVTERDGTLVVARPWVDGVPLDDAWLQSVPPLDRPRRTAEAIGQLAGILRALHGAGCVHGSLSAANVIATDRGLVVVDCGLAPAAAGIGLSVTEDDAAARQLVTTRLADERALAAMASVLGAAPIQAPGRVRRRRPRAAASESVHGRTGTHGRTDTHVPTEAHGRADDRGGADHRGGAYHRRRPRLSRHVTRVSAAALVSVAVMALLALRLMGGPAQPAQPVFRTTAAGLFLVTGRGVGHSVLPGQAGDVLFWGRWFCEGPEPALYRPATGQVFEFSSWPSAGQILHSRRTLSSGVVNGHPVAASQAHRCDVPQVRP